MSTRNASKSKTRTLNITGVELLDGVYITSTSDYSSFVKDYKKLDKKTERFPLVRKPIQDASKVTFEELESVGVDLDAPTSEDIVQLKRVWANKDKFASRFMDDSAGGQILPINDGTTNSVIYVYSVKTLSEFGQIKDKLATLKVKD